MALCVDDLQWSDPESLRFLNYLAPRLDGLPVAVFASTRSGENVTADLARLAAGPETTLLRPGPLSVEATAALCERRLGTSVAGEFATACHEATGGNPFFLEALLREAGEQEFPTESSEATRVERIGPAAVAQAVLLRLSGAPAAATALVRAVAVLGDGASSGGCGSPGRRRRAGSRPRRRSPRGARDPEAGGGPGIRSPDRARGGVRGHRPTRAR